MRNLNKREQFLLNIGAVFGLDRAKRCLEFLGEAGNPTWQSVHAEIDVILLEVWKEGYHADLTRLGNPYWEFKEVFSALDENGGWHPYRYASEKLSFAWGSGHAQALRERIQELEQRIQNVE